MTTEIVQVTPALITKDWLRSVGFKWHTVSGADPDEKNPKHWTLWFGSIAGYEPEQVWKFSDDEDLGIELTDGKGFWFCWARADYSGRYSRFLHIRHLKEQADLIRIVEALSGAQWNPANHLYGKIFTPEQVESIRRRDERLDLKIAKGRPWNKREQDDTAARPSAKEPRP